MIDYFNSKDKLHRLFAFFKTHCFRRSNKWRMKEINCPLLLPSVSYKC